MLRSRSRLNMCEQEAKFVQDRITKVEKHFADLCNSFAAYTRKVGRLRNKNDELAETIKTYAESETVNRSLSRGLLSFATTLSVIGDYRNAEVQRLESKIIAPLSQYSIICKHARENVKNTFNAREKELSRQRNLDKIREKHPQNRQMITQAESELRTAKTEVSIVIENLEKQIEAFERSKLRDLKTLLLDFITIGLSFHTKAVEYLTIAYQDVAEIDETKDLEEFQEYLNVPDAVARLDTVRRTSFRRGYSLSSISNLTNRLSSSPLCFKKTTRKAGSLDTLKHRLSNSAESIQVEEYPTNLDDDDDDDDVDDDDDDDDDNDDEEDDDNGDSESEETESTQESTIKSKLKSL